MAEDTSSTTQFSQPTLGQRRGQARVALIGRAGSGKTTLARAIFGPSSKSASTSGVTRYIDDSAPVCVDDLPGWAHGAESRLDGLYSFLESTLGAGPAFDVIWYALDAQSARITDYELRLIRRFARLYPVVVALTRADLVSAEALASMRAAIEGAAIPNNVGVVAVAADPLPALGVAPYGVAELVALTTRQPRRSRRLATDADFAAYGNLASSAAERGRHGSMAAVLDEERRPRAGTWIAGGIIVALVALAIGLFVWWLSNGRDEEQAESRKQAKTSGPLKSRLEA
jgi:hypothetical protein